MAQKSVTLDRKEPEMLYKVLDTDGSCFHGGLGFWPLPEKRPDGSWESGEWLQVKGRLSPCENGLHLCANKLQLLDFIGPAIYEAEYEGECLDLETKLVTRKARLIRKIETWDELTARSFGCDCAEQVLPYFERLRPRDLRPRHAVDITRRFIRGEVPRNALSIAADNVVKAVRGVRFSASGETNRAIFAAWAAWDTAVGSVSAAADARIAAGHTEYSWQTERLSYYLEREAE
jgi:hypothetical protein